MQYVRHISVVRSIPTTRAFGDQSIVWLPGRDYGTYLKILLQNLRWPNLVSYISDYNAVRSAYICRSQHFPPVPSGDQSIVWLPGRDYGTFLKILLENLKWPNLMSYNSDYNAARSTYICRSQHYPPPVPPGDRSIIWLPGRDYGTFLKILLEL